MTHRQDINELVTIDEQVKIIKRARGLIWEPSSWTQGHWKCEMKMDDGREMVTVMTPNNTPKYQYCVEGAVNQATYDILGEERAKLLGAVVWNNEKGELDFKGVGEDEGNDPTRLFGLDEIAQDLHGTETALEYNDQDDVEQIDPGEIHKGVLDILTTRLSQLTGGKEAA